MENTMFLKRSNPLIFNKHHEPFQLHDTLVLLSKIIPVHRKKNLPDPHRDPVSHSKSRAKLPYLKTIDEFDFALNPLWLFW